MMFFTKRESKASLNNSRPQEPLLNGEDTEAGYIELSGGPSSQIQRQSMVKDHKQRPVDVVMNRKIFIEKSGDSTEYQFTVRLNSNNTDYKVIRCFREFLELEYYVQTHFKKVVDLKKNESLSKLNEQLKKQRQENQFLKIVEALQGFLQKLVKSDKMLRDSKFLDFLEVPHQMRIDIDEMLDHPNQGYLIQQNGSQIPNNAKIENQFCMIDDYVAKSNERQSQVHNKLPPVAVKAMGYEKKSYLGEEFIEYSFFVQSLADGSHNWTLHKRYSDFMQLNDSIEGLSHYPNLPEQPRISNDQEIQECQHQLEGYLQNLIKLHDQEVLRFLENKSSFVHIQSVVETLPFTFQARILSTSIVISHKKPTTGYNIELIQVADGSPKHQPLVITRTYKQFKQLNEQLHKIFKLKSAYIPQLPSKYNDIGLKKSLEEIQQPLENYLNSILQIYFLLSSKAVATFFGTNKGLIEHFENNSTSINKVSTDRMSMDSSFNTFEYDSSLNNNNFNHSRDDSIPDVFRSSKNQKFGAASSSDDDDYSPFNTYR